MHPSRDNSDTFTYAWGKEGNGAFGPAVIGTILLTPFVVLCVLDVPEWAAPEERRLFGAIAATIALGSIGLFIQAWCQRHSQHRRITVDLQRRTLEFFNCTLAVGFFRTRTLEHCVLSPDDIHWFMLERSRVNYWLRLQTSQGRLILVSSRNDLRTLHQFLLDLTGPRPRPFRRRLSFIAIVWALITLSIFGVVVFFTF